MKFLVNCLTVTVALAVPAFAAFTVIPGKTAIAYCSSNPTPQHDNCEKAIAKISDDGDYVEGDEFQAGDCSVAILNQGQHGPYIKGVDFKYMASSILENGCYGDGWGIVGGLNVTVHLCTVCMYGTCTICNAPTRRSGATLPQLDAMPAAESERRDTTPKIPLRAALVEPRADPNHPEPLLTCGSALGPVKSDDCKAIAETLRGKELQLPFQAAHEGCSLALYAHVRGWKIAGDLVADRIVHDTDVCASKGVVGHQVDDTLQFTGLYGMGPRMWFGQLCGEFGIGLADCIQGQAPGGGKGGKL